MLTARSYTPLLFALTASLAITIIVGFSSHREHDNAIPGKAVANTPLVPRKALFGNPDKTAAQISPDGKYLSYLAPVNGVLNIWVCPIDDIPSARAVTCDTYRGIFSYQWAFNSRHLFYLQDTDGEENWHVYRADRDSIGEQDLTPLNNVQVSIIGASCKFPDDILVSMNDKYTANRSIYRLNLYTGKRELVLGNCGYFDLIADDDFRLRFASTYSDEREHLILQADDEGGWHGFLKLPKADDRITGIRSFDKTGDVVYLADSRGRDTVAATSIDLKTLKQTVVAADSRADVSGVLVHPTERTIRAVAFNYDRIHWVFKDSTIEADFKKLANVADGDIDITGGTLDDKTWVVTFVTDNKPTRYYLYDRTTGKARFLFTDRSELDAQSLQRMHSQIITTRDDLELICYLTLPPGSDRNGTGRPDRPVPMVLYVHGGPCSRDQWGFNPTHQFFANRGYAVLSVNFRGSRGCGKKLLNAGDREWGGKMHDDLSDAVDWAIQAKIAEPAKVAIVGGSYGGYATLVGLTATPEKFACGVDFLGPSDLVTHLSPYGRVDHVGDPTTPEGKLFLKDRSPLTHVSKIRRPLLIGHGANDPRVKVEQSRQMVKAMQEQKIPVTYLLFADEGHGFCRPPNSLAFYAVAEAFLAQHLGGCHEPIGTAFEDSSIFVPVGVDAVRGLRAALKR